MALAETAYCTQEQIEERIDYILTTSTKPTLVQASDFAHLRYSEMNVELASAGIGIPVDATASPYSYDKLALVNALFAASDCLEAWTAPDAEGTNALATKLFDMARTQLDMLIANPEMLSDSSRTSQAAACYQTENPEGRDLDNETSLGDDVVRPFQITDGDDRW